MTEIDRKQVEINEIAYHADIWRDAAYNPIGNKLRLQRELNLIKNLSSVKNFKRVLSIGCGDGSFEFMLAPFAEFITAIDISPEAINSANIKKNKLGIKNIDFICIPFSEIDWNKKFDSIICLAFLHHVPEKDLSNFINKAYKHVESGGFFYSQDPNVHGILRKIGRVVLGATYDKYHSPDERELDPKEMIEIFKKAGFSSFKINYTDLTLIPLLYMFTKGFEWLMYLSLFIDYIYSKSPFSHYASGFSVLCRKG